MAAVCEIAGRVTRKPFLLNLSRYSELASVGFVCSVERLRDELGVTPAIGLREGMAKTGAWYRENGWLK